MYACALRSWHVCSYPFLLHMETRDRIPLSDSTSLVVFADSPTLPALLSRGPLMISPLLCPPSLTGSTVHACLPAMGCRDVHAATVLSFLWGIASVAGLFAGTLLPNWRKLRLITFNRNEKNLTVYTGLWVKCARYDGGND